MRHASRDWRNRATGLFVAVAILAVSFLGGIQLEKHHSATAAATPTAFGTGQRPAFGGASGAPTASTAPATSTGTVTLVDGSTIYVQLSDGSVLTVKTTSATAVTTVGSTSVSSLKAGQHITVTGSTSSSGELTATTVTGGS